MRVSVYMETAAPSVLPQYSKGATVLYGSFSGTDVSDEFNDGRVYKILDEEDILAVVQ